MELNLVCDYEECDNTPLQLYYDAIEEYALFLEAPEAGPDICEDSFGVKYAFFRCPSCGDEVDLTKDQLDNFIAWADENFEGTLNGRLWFRYLKPYFEHEYEVKADEE